MTVLLVLATFLVFALVDWLVNRAPAEEKAAATPECVEGFLTPETVRYHAGHGWAARERPNLVKAGADEFAAALIGHPDSIELPKPGRWVRQGQPVWSFMRGGVKTEMVSPVEGEVVAVNPALAADPTLLRSDPYGQGWLMSVYVPDPESTAHNFVPVNLVRGWMREAVGRLWSMQPQLAGATLPDGGRPVEEPLANLNPEEWKRVTGEFFLT